MICNYELQLVELLEFEHFFSDHEEKWLEIFAKLSIQPQKQSAILNCSKALLKKVMINIKVYDYRPSVIAFTTLQFYAVDIAKHEGDFGIIKSLIKAKDEEI